MVVGSIRPVGGSACNLAKGDGDQSTSRITTGITLASPDSCRSKAHFISTSKQYSESMNAELTSRMTISALQANEAIASHIDSKLNSFASIHAF
jgi:hypothetical protein